MTNTRRPSARRAASRLFVLVCLALFCAPLPARGGLRFRQVPTLPGAEATALTSDGSSVWAATPRGVWKLSSGAWATDGLAGKPISSLAVAGGVYAADGTTVWKRSSTCVPPADPNAPCVQAWDAEALPPAVSQPSALATDGTTVWAAGVGVAKKSGGTWVALASPGGKVFSATVWSGDLVAGLRGNVARYAGSSVSFFSAGMPATANVQALAAVGGVLWAGTDQTLYSWSGSAWVAEPGFGFHDVRAVTGAGGVLRAATADAGVLKKSGSWGPDNAGILATGARSFAAAGSDLFAGTAGAPVYRLLGTSWAEAGTGLWAATISDVTAAGGSTWAAARGAGLSEISVIPGAAAGEGCGDVSALAPAGGSSLLAATNCGVTSFLLSGASIVSSTSASAGLPLGVLPTQLARVSADGSIAGGTAGAGMWRFVGSSWSADNGGLSDTASVLATREVGSTLYASSGPNLFARRQSGWQSVSGAPGLVQALGGDAGILFAAPASGGISSSSGTTFRPDDFGASTLFVSSIDAGSGLAVAGGGAGGVLRRTGGG
ncbi:MAG: hypothetical protein WCC53_07520, partial [Thermoanaerobaculia bacterium]